MKIRLDEEYPSWMKYYVDTMNLLDKVAKSDRNLTDEEKDRLDFLAEHGAGDISEIADANDCGPYGCETWDDLVVALRDLFDKGERVPIRKR